MKKILPGFAVLMKAAIFFALMLSFSRQVSAQTPAYVQEFNNYFNSKLHLYNSEGLTVIIGCADRILYTNSWRTLDTSKQVAVASISKWVTSAIIMTLVEEGKFGLDDKVGDYIDSWSINGKQDVTIRQLLSHTSGVAIDNLDVDDNGDMTLEEAVDAIALKPLLFSPGSQYLYGTSAYKVASRVAEIREGGKLWKDIFAERLKSVCGMPNADFNPLWINNPSTGAGLSVRANEYANFLRMILRHGMHNSTRVMDDTSIVAMEAYSSEASQYDTYGLGVHREQIDPNTGVAMELMHPGATGTLAWVDRNKGYYGVILSSSGSTAVQPTNQYFREWSRTQIPDNECGNTPPPSCDFNLTASNAVSGGNLNLSSSCSGADCSGVIYAWSGNGASGSSSSTSVTKPTVAGSYTYTITASKSGCSNKTANTTYTVDGGGGSTTCVNYDDECSGNSSEIRSRNITVSGAGTYSFKIHARSHEKPSIGRIRINGGSWSTFNLAQTGVSEYAERSIGSFSLNNGSNTVEFASGDGYICYRDLCVTGGSGGGCTTPSAPTLSANPTTITTSGGSSTLTASGCVSGGTITWSTGSTNSSITVTPGSTTTYTATCSKDGCTSSTASVEVTVDIEGTPPSYSQCIESENATGDAPVSSDPNASNGGTRGDENNYNKYVDYVLTGVPAAGNYTLTLQYYAANNANVSVKVGSGTPQSVTLAATYSWNIVHTTQSVTVALAAGSNTIRIQGTGGASCRQDKICVSNSSGSSSLLGIDPAERTMLKVLSVAPNPSKGIFQTDFYLEKGKKATIVVSDLQGRIIHRQAVVGHGQHRERINLLNKASGTLILQLQKDNGTEVKKINIAR